MAVTNEQGEKGLSFVDQGGMNARISVVINTLNEEQNLPFALRSVKTWADEIVVVDMHSHDRTVEIAREFGAKVYQHDQLQVVEGARTFAVNQATEPWILLLDADEIVPQPLSEKLKAIARQGSTDVVIIPRLNYLSGAPLLHSGWGPRQDPQTRFFRKGKVDLRPRIHSRILAVPGARVLTLPYQKDMAFHHFNYVDCAHFFEKLNRYTTVEAKQALERGEPSTILKAMLHGFLEFGNRYIRKQGFRDGRRGFYFSLFMVFYRVITYAKMDEFRMTGGEVSITSSYRVEAEHLLSSYEKVMSS